ncbi:glycosyltransferase family 2 protein [Chryseobacterium sp. SC28]|uniref:glycosyltransferase family 2 protein n=1 Tax=Chryseobacterium sp. SC28 TaxID=2268028 RepID=UPI000F650489|nr:glycosyltransferase family 2 protein [Chryseobacterium sp. SC28]RRQ45850.1 glycosyltransferase family 2 protein [Chryseobacterium sp. SC28]
MKILAIIVTYNSEKWIEKNISSIMQDGFEGDILVIDNGSKDQTPDIIKNNFPDVRIIESGENLGFARANNVGFEIAKQGGYDFVFLINHDGWLLPDFWSHVIPVLTDRRFAKYGLLSPVHLDATENGLDHGFRKYAGEALGNHFNTVFDVDLMNAAFLFISRKCLEDLKGFDPIFFFYGEDIDLCERAKRKGYKIGIIRGAKVVHDRHQRKMTKERLQLHLFANAIIQIKSGRNNFLENFGKALVSNSLFAFRKNPVLGYIPFLYFKNILKLMINIRRIKHSYYQYK